MQSNVFIVTSTINTNLGLISPMDRFVQTQETVQSIRSKVTDSTIILIDNSNLSFLGPAVTELTDAVDAFFDVSNRSICQLFNKSGIKGAGESYMLLVGLDAIDKNHMPVKRIFKISGRYKLSKQFDIGIYDNFFGKFCFKQADRNEQGQWFFHTRMWSACGSLLDQMKILIQRSMVTHTIENITIEQAIYKHMSNDNLVQLKTIHCEGLIAPWNILIKD